MKNYELKEVRATDDYIDYDLVFSKKMAISELLIEIIKNLENNEILCWIDNNHKRLKFKKNIIMHGSDFLDDFFKERDNDKIIRAHVLISKNQQAYRVITEATDPVKENADKLRKILGIKGE